jgi:hypothetical protein
LKDPDQAAMSARCRKATDSERLKLMAIKATRGAAIYIAGGSITLDVPNEPPRKADVHTGTASCD